MEQQKEPLQMLVVEWLLDVYISIPGQMVRNALIKTGFEWLYNTELTRHLLMD